MGGVYALRILEPQITLCYFENPFKHTQTGPQKQLQHSLIDLIGFLRGGVQGEGVEPWGTLRIPFGKIGEP